MSPIVVSGPELVIGTDTAYVALVRPQLDPADPGVRTAAEQAGVTPEEFAGPGDVWAVMWEQDDAEGDGFELPGLRDSEAEHFAEQLSTALGSGEPFTVEAGAVLRLDARPTGDGYAFSAHLTPPEPEEADALSVEIPLIPNTTLLADLEEFRRSLA
ncbi:hypothetical protein OG264_22490 [Streptomyces xanthophaeus]|uniref:hypothetical protein n=1 Tax=Streptomyces xanthophaeus TaxID=67385 RepID=UPI0038677183|nr:hypothetical protein OG264_22490 [Streptomyces xanthophaeus]WST61009.1 hypothetical protein OG605_15955 [Streptomyces xanthophaeus]